MSNPCILTDATVQFPHPTFTGNHRVKVIPLDALYAPAPTPDEMLALYTSLAHAYDSIVVLTLSDSIYPLAQSARLAAAQNGGRVPVSVIDTRNTGAGLGLLVQMAAEKAETGSPVREIESTVRAALPHLYSIYCVQNPAMFDRLGLLTPKPTAAPENPGIINILSIEDGHLVPFLKVRTTRHLLESLQEFIGEYDTPGHIALAKGRESRLRLRPLRQFVAETFPQVPFTEHVLPQTLARFLGEDALGMVVMDTPKRKSAA